MLSILIPSYNTNVYLLVKTIQNQALKIDDFVFEILVCDDASTHKHILNVEINSLLNCNFFTLKNNIGRTAVRNLLVKKAKYNTLLFLDADVLPSSQNFLKNYIDNINNQIVFGGYKYIYNRKKSIESLRYKFGLKKEEKSLSVRVNQPYKYIFSGNFLVQKKLFIDLNIPNINQYGLDMLFSHFLSSNNIKVNHIDNAIYHIGIEDNAIFFKKSISAIKFRFTHRNKIHLELEKKYALIKKFYLHRFLLLTYVVFKTQIEKNLISKKPNLLLFDFYRLGYYISLH